VSSPYLLSPDGVCQSAGGTPGVVSVAGSVPNLLRPEFTVTKLLDHSSFKKNKDTNPKFKKKASKPSSCINNYR